MKIYVQCVTLELTPPQDIPSIYVGESAKSVYERAGEHWRGFREKREDSHILKHHLLHHGGDGEPSFHMRVVGRFKSCLTRQVSEAVRIRRWGEGTVLNSKSEFNRCKLGRLTLGEEEKKAISSTKKNHQAAAPVCQEEEETDTWERSKAQEKRIEEVRSTIDLERGIAKSAQKKRTEHQEDGLESKKRARKLRFEVLGDWGEEGGRDTIENSQVQTKDDLDEEQKQEDITTKAPVMQPGQESLVREKLDTTTLEEEEPDQAPSLEDREVPDTRSKGGVEEEGAYSTAPCSPSRDTGCRREGGPKKVDKQSTLERFIVSAGTKIQTDIHTKKAVVKQRSGLSGSKKTGVRKDKDKKRKQEAPSSDKIPHYFKKRREMEDRNGDGHQVEVTSSVYSQEDKTQEDKNLDSLTLSKEDKNSTAPASEENILKKTFQLGGGVKNDMSKSDDTKCVFGGGRCISHKLKLTRSVKAKKYSCVSLSGGIEWRTRDVTCLECPSKAKKTRNSADTEIS